MRGLGIAVTLSACGGDDDSGAPTTCEELAAIVADCQGGGLAEVEFRRSAAPTAWPSPAPVGTSSKA